MAEYAVVVSKNFSEVFLGITQNMTHFLSGVPFYWYIIAAVGLIVLIRLFSGK